MRQVQHIDLYDKKKFKLGTLHPILAFVIPFAILFFAYAAVHIYPFGDRQILTVDLFHQYAPFLRELRSKILSGQSLFFSWSGGLGISFLPLFAYYLASPFNLLLVFFSDAYLAEGILLISLLKVGLTGFCMYFFLRKGRALSKNTSLIFAIPYALSAFVLAYSWNIMWLDVIFYLPIVAYTAQLIVVSDRLAPYMITLSLMILSNYYLAFFVCLFLMFYYPAILIQDFPRHCENKLLTAFKKLVYFAIGSLMAGLAAAVLLWPTYLSLKETSAAGDSFPTAWTFKQAVIDIWPRMLFAQSPNIRQGLPNLYIGVFVFILIPLYFLSKRIAGRAKVVNLALISILVFSFSINTLDFIWHGMHYPNQLPYRYAFLLAFVLLTLSAQAWEALSWTGEGSIMKVLAGVLIFILLWQKIQLDSLEMLSLLVSLVFIIAYAMTARTAWRAPGRHALMATVLFLLMAFEISLSTFFAVQKIAENEYYGIRDGYAYGQDAAEIRSAAAELRAKHPQELVRTELRPKKAVNDPMLYGLNGFSVFSSSFPQKPVILFEKLGYPTNGVNSFEYTDSTPAMSSLLSLRYLINRSLDKELVTTASPEFEGEKIKVYSQQNVFPLAVAVQPSAGHFASVNESPFANQNQLFHDLFVASEIFKAVTFREIDRSEAESSMAVAVASDSEASAETSEEGEARTASANTLLSEDAVRGGYLVSLSTERQADPYYLELEAEESGRLFFFFKAHYVKISDVSVRSAQDDFFQSRSSRRVDMIDCGEVTKGDRIRITFTFRDPDNTGSLELFSAVYQADAFAPVIAEVQKQDFKALSLNSRGAAFALTSPQDGYAFVSTTYDPGWQVLVDGQLVQTFALGECFLMFPLGQGRHEIEMTFTPLGFHSGLIISLSAWALILLILLLEYLGERRDRQGQEYEAYEADLYRQDLENSYYLEAYRPGPEQISPELREQHEKARRELSEAILAAEGQTHEAEFVRARQINALTVKGKERADESKS